MKREAKNTISVIAGFTIIELIIVIAILSILAGIAVPSYSAYVSEAIDAAINMELHDLSDAACAAAVLAGTEIYRITVSPEGEVAAYVPCTFADDGVTVLTCVPFDIGSMYDGIVDGLERHSDFSYGCTWMGEYGAWVAGVDQEIIIEDGF